MSAKKILISQKVPASTAIYDSITEKFGVSFDFRPFYKIEPLSSIEFRSQRLNVLEHTAIVFSARSSIDAFFKICEEHRIKIPETMKYFCTTEIVANYLQKHIVYRKRKIFFGDGSAESIISSIGTKHAGEKFLVITCDTTENEITHLFDAKGLKYTSALFVKSVFQDITDLDISDYLAVVVYNPSDVASLAKNFPSFKESSLSFISYGKSAQKALEAEGLPIAVSAPNEKIPSAAKAIEVFLSSRSE